MKKTIIAILIASVFAAAMPAFASDWNSFVREMAGREKIKEHGAAVIAKVRASEPQGSDYGLWSMLWNGSSQSRIAAAVALMDRLFPNGDPARWQETSGFLSEDPYRPKQLAAMDAFFVAVTELSKTPDGVWGAAFLFDKFADSGMGRLTFIDEIPAGMDDVIRNVIAQTGLRGDWSSKRVRGSLPLLPVFKGYASRTTADNRGMTYIDGFGDIASNGRYAWDRDRGYIFEVREDSGGRGDGRMSFGGFRH